MLTYNKQVLLFSGTSFVCFILLFVYYLYLCKSKKKNVTKVVEKKRHLHGKPPYFINLCRLIKMLYALGIGFEIEFKGKIAETRKKKEAENMLKR